VSSRNKFSIVDRLSFAEYDSLPLPPLISPRSLCEFKPGSEDDSFINLDPKRKDAVLAAKGQPKSRPPFREVLVFMVGGGSYSEYHQVQDYAKRHSERQVTYGCTEVTNGEAFLKQLSLV